MVYFPSLILPVTVILAYYPGGRLPTRRWRLPVGAVGLGLTVVTVGASLSRDTYKDIAPGRPPLQLAEGWWSPAIVGTAFAMLIGGAVAVWVLTGFRLARAGLPERPQLAWYVGLVIPFLVLIFFGRFPEWVGLTAGLAIPLAIAIGVLRYQMLDIVLRPVIVFGLLTLVVVAVYVAVTALAGSALDQGPLPGVLAAALVAVGLTPARERIQHGVDRFVYGERRDPLRAVATLGNRVAAADERILLEAAAASVADAVRAPGAMVMNRSGRVLASHGDISEVAVSLPLVVAGSGVGVLAVSARSAGSRYSDADRRVLGALAPQVAVVVHALQLADALELQRDRVVAATKSERDRLRHALHDGLGPASSGTALGLQATADALADGRSASAEHLVSRMRTEVDNAVVEVRRIIDGLRPAELDEGGLDLAEAVGGTLHLDTGAHGTAVTARLPLIRADQ